MKHIWKVITLFLLLPLLSLGQISEKGFPEFSMHKQIDIPVIVLPGVDHRKLNKEDKKQNQSRLKKIRYAQILEVDLSPDDDGVWVEGNAGEKIWYLKIISPSAYSLGILFDHYRLPVGAKLFVYSSDEKHVRGAFTYKNNKTSYMLPMAPVKGDEIILEYHEPKKVAFKGELHISSVAHDYKNIFNYLTKGEKGFGDSGECNININCDNDELWQLIKHAVCKITYNGWLCSGALINNTKQNGHPYFLTANHCINNSVDATAANFYFNYESPDCSNINGSMDQSIAGAIIISTPPEETIDFSLLELSALPPPDYKPYYAGWNRDIKDPTSVTSIHHPSGDIKKITKSYSGATTGDYGEGYDPYKHWHIAEWDEGTTEGGSSGSPLFDPNGRIIGDLTGGDATCQYNFDDYYQQLYHSWQDFDSRYYQLKYWLDPIHSEAVTLDGFLPYDTVPSNLKAYLIDTLVNLRWNDVIDSANIDFYYVYRNGLKIDSVKNTTYSDTLKNNNLYKYYVTAMYNSPLEIESLASNAAFIRTYDIDTLTYSETFEDPTDIYDYWYEERSNDTIGWNIQTGGFTAILDTAFEGKFNAYFHNNDMETSKLVLPKFDLSDYTHVKLSFYLNMQEFNNDVDKLNVLYKETDTVEWKTIRSYNTGTIGWERKEVSLPALTDNYQIAFEGVGLRGLGICIDSIKVAADNNFINPNFSNDKDLICISDSVQYTTTIGNSNEIYWNFGNDAIPSEAYGIGPHWVKYTSEGIKSLQIMVNGMYIKNDNDVIVVYKEPDLPTIKIIGNQLVSSAVEGNQWFLNGQPIDGATNRSYTIDEDGDYFVEVTNSFDCNAISESLQLVVSESKPLTEIISDELQVNIFPNPNNGNFNVKININNGDETYYYRIFDINGSELKTGTLFNNNENHKIVLEKCSEGVYFIQLYSEENYYTSKILIKK